MKTHLPLSIRRWLRADLPAIQQLLLDTWLDAYGSFIPREDLSGYLHTHYSQAKLEALFDDPDVTGLVAEAEGAVIGYAKLYHNRPEQRFYLHQLYILPSRQGLGLGHRLMACAEERARELGANYIFCRKPSPTLISTDHFDEDAIRADIRATVQAAGGLCPLEFAMKDVHTLKGQPQRLGRWVQLAREVTAAA